MASAKRRTAAAGASPTAALGAVGLTIPKMFAGSLAYLSLALGTTLFYRVSAHVLGPGAFMLSVPKIITGSFAPFIAIMGAVGSALGVAIGVAERRAFDRSARPPSGPRRGFRLSTLLVVVAGATGAVIAASHARQVTADHNGFEEAFGPGWRSAIPPELAPRMLQSRRTWKLSDPAEPRWERDVAFWTVPGGDRRLMADVWQPPPGVKPSGLAFIYLHGGGYVAFDKDRGTRPMFRHLAAQGHVVMDVSYRLHPETNIPGMVGDTLRAVAWMKRNAAKYGVDPARIVLAGGSAGAHLALLAAYAPEHPLVMPADVRGDELGVRGVVAYYSPGDWRPERKLSTPPGPVKAAVRRRLTRLLETWSRSRISSEADLLGGQPHEWPELCRQVSPITHVGPHTPPTLQFVGAHDVYVSAAGTMPELHRKLREVGVPSVYVEFPRTEHAFDMFFPEYSPSAHAALYDLDRFLALMASALDFGSS